MTFTGGTDLTAALLNELDNKAKMRGRRTTASTAASAIQGVIRLDDQPITAGRLYYIFIPVAHANSTVVTDELTVSILYTTDGSTPTTSSSVIPGGQMIVTAGDESGLGVFYTPASNETLSVLVTTLRFSGTGNVSLFADGTRITEILILDLGADPGDTGTDI